MNWHDRPAYDDVDEEARMDVSCYDPDYEFRPDPADYAGLDGPITYGRPNQCTATGQGWEPCDRDKHDDGKHWCRSYGGRWAAKWDDDGNYETRQIAGTTTEGKNA